MTTMITFVVPGEPRSWKRPSGTLHRYVTKTEASLRKAIGTYARIAMRGREPLTGPVGMTVKAVFPLGKHADGDWHMARPDADNVAKLINDSLLAICFDDDSQISWLLVEKRYGSDPRVEVTVVGLNTISAPKHSSEIGAEHTPS